jgi:DNA replication protein DnaC
LRKWQGYSGVILDELGFVPLSREGAQVLFQFVANRYDHRRSLIITTNLEFSRWTEVFHDPPMTAAMLDRLTYRCHLHVTNRLSHLINNCRPQKGCM